MTRRLVTTLFFFTALTLLPLPASALLQKGEQFPEITGKTLAGEEFSLSSLEGKPFLLKIGTTWCGTCNSQAKAIDEIRTYLSENQIQLVEVFIQESAKKVRKYFNKKGYQLPDTTILDKGNISKKLNVYVIPRVILVDKNHQVYRDGDNLTSSNLKKKLEQMLAGN
jgi:thiol-disulfide isomerase/thioredoxin